MAQDIFCSLYQSWKTDRRLIFENDHAYSIFSVTPAAPGHAIVISNPHVGRLEQLRGQSLEDFVDAIPATISAIQDIYRSDPETIVAFYRSLISHPPTPASADRARRMLEHKHLRVMPESDYNVGINVGGCAGQIVDHLHVQLFPRREKGQGIVTAMQSLLSC